MGWCRPEQNFRIASSIGTRPSATLIPGISFAACRDKRFDPSEWLLWVNKDLIILSPSITLMFISGLELLSEAQQYNVLKPEQKRIDQSLRTCPRLLPSEMKVFNRICFCLFYKTLLWHFNYRRSYLLLMGGKLISTISKLKGGII